MSVAGLKKQFHKATQVRPRPAPDLGVGGAGLGCFPLLMVIEHRSVVALVRNGAAALQHEHPSGLHTHDGSALILLCSGYFCV